MSRQERVAAAIYDMRRRQWAIRWPDIANTMVPWPELGDAARAEYLEQAHAAIVAGARAECTT